MNKIVFLKFIRFFFRRIPNRVFIILIEQLFLSKNVNPLRFAYSRIGVYKPENIKEVLKSEVFKDFHEKKKLTVFDVGANIGDFTQEILELKPNTEIWSFEPLPDAYKSLKDRFEKMGNVNCVKLALDNKQGDRKIYTYENTKRSEHSSLHKSVLIDLHHVKQIKDIEIITNTLDNFCTVQNIQSIDYLKIDTEGNELSILKGSKRLLQKNKIKIIQFELNEMHIVSRVFLKDFYDLLPNFSFYRINQDYLIPLEDYQSINEIHQFQNIIAISNI